ncbi:MAG: hypothetical protein AB4063_22770 [Crocosphaera sp.]
MLENNIELTISFSDTQLSETDLQVVISQNILPEIQRVEGVKQVGLIPMEEAPKGAKSLSGYLLGKLKVVTKVVNLKSVITWVSKNMSQKNIEIYAKKQDKNGKLKELKINIPYSTQNPLITPEKLNDLIDNFLD